MHFLRCVLAEWQLVRVRLLRSRLGIWLLLLGVGSVAVAGNDALIPLALRVGMLGAVLGVAFGAGSDADRGALAVTLAHPTTPLAVALGRWLAALTASGCVMLAALMASVALGRGGGADVFRAASTGGMAGAATASATLLGVWLGGNAVAAALFLYIGVASVPQGPLGRLGQPSVWVQAVTTVAGVGASAWLLARRRSDG